MSWYLLLRGQIVIIGRQQASSGADNHGFRAITLGDHRHGVESTLSLLQIRVAIYDMSHEGCGLLGGGFKTVAATHLVRLPHIDPQSQSSVPLLLDLKELTSRNLMLDYSIHSSNSTLFHTSKL